ncbi:MAG: FGGY-family carbohydrate kinase [Deltaproteobacteria bacterium]|jgi:xylulokinase|nr:FGGY-family carbohydrate kinase [Deltaproteobacteria bacterium]
MNQTRFCLGIDVGTTSVKVILISSDGRIVDEESVGHDLISLHPNWAEENALLWWAGVREGVKGVCRRNAALVDRLDGIGVSSMTPSIVMTDESGHPVRLAIQQNDARALDQIAEVAARLDQDELFRLTGGRTNQQHVLPRLLWVKQNEPDVWRRTASVAGACDFIIHRLTGQWSIEANWAAESGLYDIRRQTWIDEYFAAFDVPQRLFPKVNPSISVVGRTKDFMSDLGLPGGVAVIAGTADHVASTLAAGVVDEGDLLIKFGGAGDILYCLNSVVVSEKLFFDYHIVPGKYLLNGCMAASGSLVKWFTKDILNIDDPAVFRDMDQAAEKVPPASDGLIVLPYFLGEKTPIMDPEARGVMFGLTLSHTRAHIFRAVLEAVIYGFRHHLDVMRDMGYSPKRIRAANGGAKSSFWCQIASDVLAAPIISFPSHPGSALGAAFLAGMSVGVFRAWEEIDLFLKDYQSFEPNPANVAVYDQSYVIYRSIYEELKPSFKRLRNLRR